VGVQFQKAHQENQNYKPVVYFYTQRPSKIRRNAIMSITIVDGPPDAAALSSIGDKTTWGSIGDDRLVEI
jgi:hypothetical protein